MSEIHKFICDVCGKEKEITPYVLYEVAGLWQTFIEKHELFGTVEKHVCSNECAIKFFTEKK